MSEQNKKMTQDTSTEEKMKELFDLMDQKAAAGELQETDEDLKAKKEAGTTEPAADAEKKDEGPMSASETAAYEYSMMMNQYEAMLMDWQRREAEEKTEKETAAKAAEEAKEKDSKEN